MPSSFDGQGLAQPRRFGLACHGGLLLGTPSVGCAKSILVGEHGPLGRECGERAALVHAGETVGAAVRTRDGVAPVYVSAGHLVDLASAVELVLRASGRFRIPEPIRLAHHAPRELMRQLWPRPRPAGSVSPGNIATTSRMRQTSVRRWVEGRPSAPSTSHSPHPQGSAHDLARDCGHCVTVVTD